ncbi:MAG: Holliday junction resolvase RuvX [Candidatus Sumerlaeaceae bacterium]
MTTKPSTRIVALDVGDVRIGVAVSDPTLLLASPFTIVHRKEGNAAGRIAQIVQEQGSMHLLVGLPKNMDGSIGPQAKKVQAFVEQLRDQLADVDFVFWDERRTTMEARANRISAGKKKSQRAQALDSEAAAVLLQSYLEYLRHQ